MSRPKIIRVVTAAYVVPWHLGNTLRRMPADFEVTVVGQDVSSNGDAYPGVQWVDIDLDRKVSPIADLRSLWALCRLFQRAKPDIVHSIMPKAGLLTAVAGLLCRVPIRVHTFTGQVWVNRKFPARSFLYLVDRVINGLNSVCMTDSPSQSEFLREHGISHRGKPLPVLGCGSLSGVDLSRFDSPGEDGERAQLRADLSVGMTDFVFTYLARKTRDKGAFDMLDAFARIAIVHPEAKLLFIGPDESNGELAALRRQSPARFRNVIELGQVNHHERYLSISDVLCLPSYREGFGSIVIDAAAAGVPAIGSNIVGLVDSIEDGKTGILFPAGDVDALARAMRSMIDSPDRCAGMGVAARRRAGALFAADSLYAALRKFYLDLCATLARK